jgi:hypothetical protein
MPEFDRETVERLQALVGRTINDSAEARTHADIIVALLGVVAAIIGKVSCPHCREDIANWAHAVFHDVIDQAMDELPEPQATHQAALH